MISHIPHYSKTYERHFSTLENQQFEKKYFDYITNVTQHTDDDDDDDDDDHNHHDHDGDDNDDDGDDDDDDDYDCYYYY